MNQTTNKNLSFDAVMPKHRDLYYGGEWHAPVAGKYAETINPANQEVLGSVAQGDEKDAARAVQAAHKAFATWGKLKPQERAAMMRNAANVLRDNAEELAMLDAYNTGNPVAEMVSDARVAAASLDYFAGLALETKGDTIPGGTQNLHFTVREPLGVVARIVAYNHPLMFAAAKIAAPLAAGNTVVVKAPDQAPLSALRMAELIGGCFPAGVLNVLSGGAECGKGLSTDPLVKKVTLIGSIPTARAIARAGADTLKQVLFELGGKNALIAYPDADVDKLVDGIVRGMNFTWAGQSCGSTSRVFLHSSLHDRVLEGVVALLRERHHPGDPTDFSTTMGPLISKAAFDKTMGFINDTKAEGGRLVCGGKQPDNAELQKGFFIEPTIFADMKPEMRLAREEVFGPVMAVFKWDDEDAMFEIANSVEYGLTASIWTRDLVTALRAVSRVEAGFTWVNNTSQHFLGVPFGGYKQSGIGREECVEELLEFTQVKSVSISLG